VQRCAGQRETSTRQRLTTPRSRVDRRCQMPLLDCWTAPAERTTVRHSRSRGPCRRVQRAPPCEPAAHFTYCTWVATAPFQRLDPPKAQRQIRVPSGPSVAAKQAPSPAPPAAGPSAADGEKCGTRRSPLVARRRAGTKGSLCGARAPTRHSRWKRGAAGAILARRDAAGPPRFTTSSAPIICSSTARWPSSPRPTRL
jgi:hypothetical protein